MMPSFANVVAYSVQLAVLAIAAQLITHVVRLRTPQPSLRFWQAIFAASVLLPWLQPRDIDGGVTLSTTALASLAASMPVDVVTARATGAAQWLIMMIAAGVAIKLLWLGAGMARLRGINRRASFDRSLDSVLRELTRSVGAAATIAISDDVESPATVGVRRPLILLPRRILVLPQAVQRAVIAHELVHVRRGDWLATIVEELWCSVLWFHPTARLLASRLSLARETVVDELTIRLTQDRRAYAEALLAFANPQPHLPGVTPFIGRRHLSQRISLIAEEDVMNRRRLLVSFATAVIVCSGATISTVTAFPMTTIGHELQIYRPGDGVTLPSSIHEVRPDYTPEAMEKKIQGNVVMAVVVRETGDVGDVHVRHSLDAEYGLDRQAVVAIKQWKFRPGMKDGQPVAVEIFVQVSFTLK
jgi:TonB family protein